MTQPVTDRLLSQIGFIKEIDKLKSVFRQTPLLDQSRKENDAEHSWHLATMAMVLAEYAPPGVQIERVMKMVLIHDIVEIDAGDTFVYDDLGISNQEAREQEAADRLFSLLPQNQATEFRALWDEFEAEQTADARFARALDRLQPLLHNHQTEGVTWRKHDVTKSQVLEKKQAIIDGAPELWPFALLLIQESVDNGWLIDS
jgi:putative hydrolases of HD superfamily